MGRPLGSLNKKKRAVEERFWEKVGPYDDPNVCWLWQAGSTDGGCGLRYGQFWDGVQGVKAHRFSYEMHHHVIIPEWMTIDHVRARGCTSTLCVNPHHLEVVTRKVNTLRGDTLAAKEVLVLCCPQGHLYSKENTYVNHGKRYCRICARAAGRAWYHNHKGGQYGRS